jgi:hypothetical protein
MAKVAKISPIKKEYSSNFSSLDSSLARHGYARTPGTTVTRTPYKEKTGLYRTGFEIDSPQMLRLKELSLEQYEAEVKKRIADKERLGKAIGCPECLEGNSDFYNYASLREKKVTPVKLGTSDTYFDLNDPYVEITWYWIKSHPLIATSMEAYRRGEFPAETQYFIADDEAENKLVYTKKKEINKAIARFEDLDNKTKLQVARLMALPVSDSTPDEEVYNIVDSALKEAEFKGGKFKGMSPIRLFNEIVNLSPERRKVKDIVEQALIRNIYRIRAAGKVYEGENVVANSVNDFVDYLLDDEHQDDYLALEKKLSLKKVMEIS